MTEGFVPGFFAGIRSFVTGLGMLAEPGMRRYAILPLVLSVLAFAGLIVLAVFFFGDVAGWVRGQLPGYLAWTVWLLWIALVAVFVFGFYFTFTMVVGLVGLPIFMLLANAVERRMTGHIPESHRGLLYLTWIGFWRQFPRFWYLGLWLVAALAATLILAFIPVVNILITILWFVFGAWAFAVMMSDFPLGARDLPWKEQLVLIKRHRGRILGFGAAASGMALIPVLNLLLLAAATAGVTVTWIEALGE